MIKISFAKYRSNYFLNKLVIIIFSFSFIAYCNVAFAKNSSDAENKFFESRILYKNNRFREALISARMALAIKESMFKPDDIRLADNIELVALILFKLSDVNQAELLLKRSLSIKEKSFGIEDYRVAFTLSSLADVYLDLGRYKEAEDLGLRSLAIREKILGSVHPDYVVSLKNLGWVYIFQQNIIKRSHTLDEPFHKAEFLIIRIILH